MRMSEVLIPAIRQYKHNDGSEGFVMAYDKTETDKAVNQLTDENARLRELLSKSNSLLITTMLISEDTDYSSAKKIRKITFHKNAHVNPHVIKVDELLNKDTKR